jgi:soluble cytochrome b562
MKMLTLEQEFEFKTNLSCPECKCEYTKENYKVRDHDHPTGEFRRPLCNGCNLKNQKPKFVPVFFHNLKGYDSHLILSAIKRKDFDGKNRTIEIIPNNSEKYISFNYKEFKIYQKDGKTKQYVSHEIRFLDSFAFMASSLDGLSKNLNEGQFKITKAHYSRLSLVHTLDIAYHSIVHTANFAPGTGKP